MEDPKLNLIVLRSQKISQLLNFYESLGLKFTEEQHEEGPIHYSTNQNSMTFELYPANKHYQDNIMLGFTISNLEKTIQETKTTIHKRISKRTIIVKDPDGRLVYLTQSK